VAMDDLWGEGEGVGTREGETGCLGGFGYGGRSKRGNGLG